MIVVDAGSIDETLAIAAKSADKVLKGTPSRINRNKGVEEAAGGILCFTDSDCVVPEDWIDKLVSGLIRLNSKDNKVVGVGGGDDKRNGPVDWVWGGPASTSGMVGATAARGTAEPDESLSRWITRLRSSVTASKIVETD